MNVHIIGPNLIDQTKGDFHIHKEDCADVRRDPNYAGPEHEYDRVNTYDVDSIQEIIELIYVDQMGEGSMVSWQEGVGTVWLAPCVIDDLPSVTPPKGEEISDEAADAILGLMQVDAELRGHAPAIQKQPQDLIVGDVLIGEGGGRSKVMDRPWWAEYNQVSVSTEHGVLVIGQDGDREDDDGNPIMRSVKVAPS